MADNTTLNAMSGGDSIATDDIGGVKHQLMKMEFGAADSATQVSPTTPLPAYIPDINTNNTIAVLNGTVTLASLPGTGALLVQILGTWVGTLQFEWTIDGTNWSLAQGFYYPFGAGPSSNFTTSVTANGNYVFNNFGFTGFRVKATAYTSGTATVYIRGTSGSPTVDRFNQYGIKDVNAAGSANVNLQQDSADNYALRTTGGVASGATDAGSPVKTGGKYNSTLPTFTTGQRGDSQIDDKGYARSTLRRDENRTHISLYAVGAASGTTGTETAITLTKSSGTGATSSAATFVITSGKKFRITHISVASRGHATGTAQVTTFALRVNTAGAVGTTSTPVVFSARSATPATASAWDRYIIPIPEGFEITGDGTLQIGVTANAVFVTNAPTWDVNILGYEY